MRSRSKICILENVNSKINSTDFVHVKEADLVKHAITESVAGFVTEYRNFIVYE